MTHFPVLNQAAVVSGCWFDELGHINFILNIFLYKLKRLSCVKLILMSHTAAPKKSVISLGATYLMEFYLCSGE